jgi:hypothetical protein
MLSQFDPEIANLFRGEITAVEVNDPAILGHVPNLVLNPNRPFEVRVDWTLTGSEVPVYLKALEDSDWIVTVYAESMGPGPEVKLGEGTEPNGFTVSTSPTPAFSWSHTLRSAIEAAEPGPADDLVDAVVTGAFRLRPCTSCRGATPSSVRSCRPGFGRRPSRRPRERPGSTSTSWAASPVRACRRSSGFDWSLPDGTGLVTRWIVR